MHSAGLCLLKVACRFVDGEEELDRLIRGISFNLIEWQITIFTSGIQHATDCGTNTRCFLVDYELKSVFTDKLYLPLWERNK